MKAILNNKDYLKDEICKAIDNAGAAAPYGNITNGDILDALLELRDTLLTNIAKQQLLMEKEMWLARDKDNELFLFIGKKPYKSGEIWHHPYARNIIIQGRYPEVKWSDDEPTKVKLVIDK